MKHLIFLNLIVHVYSTEMMVYKSILGWADTVSCDLKELEKWPDTEWPDEPHVIRHHKLNEKFRKKINLTVLKNRYGDREVGIDFPGTRASPTENWRKIRLSEYIQEYVNHSKTVEDMITDEKKNVYLWGPTDTCDRFKGKQCEHHLDPSLIPKSVVDDFKCVDEDNKAKLFGLNGAYTGLNFHFHDPVINEVIFGSRIWFFYKPGIKIADEGKTAIDMIHTMVMEYWDDPTFVKPLLCKVEPGDTVFIPDKWVHMTFNLEPTMVGGCNLERKYQMLL